MLSDSPKMKQAEAELQRAMGKAWGNFYLALLDSVLEDMQKKTGAEAAEEGNPQARRQGHEEGEKASAVAE